MSCPGASDRLQRNIAIESRQPSVIPYCQPKQISIRDLLMPENVRWLKQRFVQERHRVFPEVVIRRGAGLPQSNANVGDRDLLGELGRVAYDADAAVNRHRASCPPMAAVQHQPAMRQFVVAMGGIDQRHEHVDV